MLLKPQFKSFELYNCCYNLSSFQEELFLLPLLIAFSSEVNYRYWQGFASCKYVADFWQNGFCVFFAILKSFFLSISWYGHIFWVLRVIFFCENNYKVYFTDAYMVQLGLQLVISSRFPVEHVQTSEGQASSKVLGSVSLFDASFSICLNSLLFLQTQFCLEQFSGSLLSGLSL